MNTLVSNTTLTHQMIAHTLSLFPPASIWEAGNSRPGAPRRVELADVCASAPDFARRANTYYLDRYDELSERELLAVAWAVADAFGAGPPPRRVATTLGETEVRGAVQRGLGTDEPEQVRDATEALFRLGLIWRAGGAPDWAPGIPSLMGYLWNEVSAADHPAVSVGSRGN